MQQSALKQFIYRFAFTAAFAAFFISQVGVARQLQLQDIVRLGVERSPIMKKAEADLADIQAQTKEYKAEVYPTISGDLSDTSQQFPGSSSSTNSVLYGNQLYKSYIALSQPLYVGGLISSGIDLQKQKEAAQSLQNLSAKDNLVLNLVTAYYNFAEQAHLATAAERNEQLLADYDKIIVRYQKIGRARMTDRMQADVNLQLSQADANSAESSLVQQKEQLRQLLALDEFPDVAVPHELISQKVDQLNPKDAVASALQTNPDVLLLEKQRDEIANERAVDLSQDLPNLYLTGQYGYESGNTANLTNSSNHYSQVTLELKIPIFSGLSSVYKRRSYAAKKESAVRNIEATKLQIEASLRSQINELEAAYERLQLARQADITARNALKTGMKDYQRGLLSTQDVISLQGTRYSAEKLFITTHFGYLVSLANARRLMGMDLEEIYGGRQ